MDETGIRAVARAIAVLRALQDGGPATLADLHRRTALPKPSLLRLLATLEAERAVWRAQGDALWRAAVELRPSAILRPADQALIDAAMPALDALRHAVVWPSDLAVRDGERMRLLETTRRASGLAVNRDEIGLRIDMLRSAVGRAYLGACGERERAAIARLLAQRQRRALDAVLADITQAVEEFTRQGYAVRVRGFGGHDEAIERFDDQLDAIAVPIVAAGRALGSINVVWLRRVDRRAAVVARHLPRLQAARAAIAAAFEAQRAG